jgi:hypothetical protein
MTVSLGGRPVGEFEVAPGPFLQALPMSSADLGAQSRGNAYLELSIAVAPLTRVAVEQFDASGTRTIFGYGDGWQEPEYNPTTGLRWRWMSERGELRVVRTRHGKSSDPLMLHIEGESPLKYFSRPSRLVVRAAGRVLLDRSLDDNFSVDFPLPDADTVTLETDQFFSPADRSRPWRRSGDRRHLGLRIFKCEIRQAF